MLTPCMETVHWVWWGVGLDLMQRVSVMHEACGALESFWAWHALYGADLQSLPAGYMISLHTMMHTCLAHSILVVMESAAHKILCRQIHARTTAVGGVLPNTCSALQVTALHTHAGVGSRGGVVGFMYCHAPHHLYIRSIRISCHCRGARSLQVLNVLERVHLPLSWRLPPTALASLQG